ncbi:glycosyl hydrolase family 65 protein, partial [Desulfocurvibacter africanus]|uniref:glycosyl hydrolase family 65 protein n=1 Tax=Desulfocurvibacter africanus TaxID=873 RepID=UPI002FDA9FC9
EARAMAKDAGHSGAMYPWQSGSSGREESQLLHLNPKSGQWGPDNSRLQRHVNAAIAFNISQYYQVTGDLEFMAFYGLEMLLEIARFWAAVCVWNQEMERYEIKGVMGPDEYHEGYPWRDEPGLDNNFYTNLMAVWTLDEALRLLDLMPEDVASEVSERVYLHKDELQHWEHITERMRLVFLDTPEGQVPAQFEHYDRLEEFDWQGYRQKYGDIQRLDRVLKAEGDTPNRYKASKQADALMVLYLFSREEIERLFSQLGYPFDPAMIPRTIEYYLARTSHGSTLSFVVHARVLSRLDRRKSWSLFCDALKSDVEDIQGGTTPEGIHAGAMAGAVDIIQRGYTDMEMRGDVLWFNPRIPEPMERMKTRIRFRGHSLQIEVTEDLLTVTACRTAMQPIRIGYKNRVYTLQSGDVRMIKLVGG